MRDMGIRGRFAYGTPVGLSDDARRMERFWQGWLVKRDWMPDKDESADHGHLFAPTSAP